MLIGEFEERMVSMKQTLLNSKISVLQMLLVVSAVAAYLISNVITNFQWYLGGMVLTGGILTFPITYVLSDLFSEIYGYKWSRRCAWISFAVNVVFVVLLFVLFHLPACEWTDVAMWESVLGSSARILAGSFLAFVLGGWLDDLVFLHFRKKDGEKKFAPRAILSSFVGECADSLIFYPIAFAGTMPVSAIVNMMVIGVVLKTSYEVLVLPITVKLVKWLDAKGERQYCDE